MTEEEASPAWVFAWAARWKASEFRARVCVRGLEQPVEDLRSFFASTLCSIMLKLLIMSPSSCRWIGLTLETTTAPLSCTVGSVAGSGFVLTSRKLLLSRALFGDLSDQSTEEGLPHAAGRITSLKLRLNGLHSLQPRCQRVRPQLASGYCPCVWWRPGGVRQA